MKSIQIVLLGIFLSAFFSYAENVSQEKAFWLAGYTLVQSNTLYAAEKQEQHKPPITTNNDTLKNEGVKPGNLKAPIFKPSLPLGAPVQRIAGGSRGIGEMRHSVLCVLTPDHTGLTLQKQPSLYYFLSESVANPMELTIIEESDAIEPLLEVEITPAEMPGIQSIHLTGYDIHLQQDKIYRWYVSIILDPNSRAKDILAWGRVQRIKCPDKLQKKIYTTTKNYLTHTYAEAGIWYDALSDISNQIYLEPRNSQLRKQRAALLKQVDLQQVVQFEMNNVVEF